MKNSLFILILIALTTTSITAQTDTTQEKSNKKNDEIKTLFKTPPGKTSVGFFAGPGFSYTQFKGKDVYLADFSAGIILNHNFSVGFSGKGIMNSQSLRYSDIKDTIDGYLYGGYGGLRLEYILNPKSPVHICFPLIIGGGGMMYSAVNFENSYGHNNQEEEMIDEDAFFVLEPGIMLGMNLTKYMRFDAGVTYRYVPNLDLLNTSNSLLNNFNGCFSLKFGKF
jgi:hypothetical protein